MAVSVRTRMMEANIKWTEVGISYCLNQRLRSKDESGSGKRASYPASRIRILATHVDLSAIVGKVCENDAKVYSSSEHTCA